MLCRDGSDSCWPKESCIRLDLDPPTGRGNLWGFTCNNGLNHGWAQKWTKWQRRVVAAMRPSAKLLVNGSCDTAFLKFKFLHNKAAVFKATYFYREWRNFDQENKFCISQGSVVTFLGSGGQHYYHYCQNASVFCKLETKFSFIFDPTIPAIIWWHLFGPQCILIPIYL